MRRGKSIANYKAKRINFLRDHSAKERLKLEDYSFLHNYIINYYTVLYIHIGTLNNHKCFTIVRFQRW